jgi:hypothetical protein
MRLLVGLVLGTAGLGWGTSCGPEILGPLCQQLNENAILFFGTVVEHAPPMQGRWSRLAVKEIFRGLPAGTTEVILFPGSWTGLTVGESYLLTADPWRNYNSKPWTWDRLKLWWKIERHWPEGVRLQSWDCNYLREGVRVPQEDWDYAREVRDGKARRRIYGRVSAVGRLWPGGGRWPKLPGATVRIHGKSKTWSATTDANGLYSMENVEPGQYWVEAEKRGYTSIGSNPEFEVKSQGCGFGPIALTAAGRIEGRVGGSNGLAAAGATVSYRYEDSSVGGEIGSTTTNEKGEFVFDDAPSGNLMLEARPPNSAEPYSTMGVRLGLNEVRKGIVFRLAPTPFKRILTVRVRWPDGRPAAGVEVFGETHGSFAGRLTSGADGIAKLPVYSGHVYSILASVKVDGKWTGAGARVEPQTTSVDLVLVKAPSQSR